MIQQVPIALFFGAATMWLLCTGATFLLVKLIWINRILKQNKELYSEIQKTNSELKTLKSMLSDLKSDCIAQFTSVNSLNVETKKSLDNHKIETTKIFETITEGFEFINSERIVMINDLAELKQSKRKPK